MSKRHTSLPDQPCQVCGTPAPGDVFVCTGCMDRYHGDLAEENKLGQRFIVDLVLALDIAEVARTDALEATVDYVRVHEVCRELVEGKKVRISSACSESKCATISEDASTSTAR